MKYKPYLLYVILLLRRSGGKAISYQPLNILQRFAIYEPLKFNMKQRDEFKLPLKSHPNTEEVSPSSFKDEELESAIRVVVHCITLHQILLRNIPTLAYASASDLRHGCSVAAQIRFCLRTREIIHKKRSGRAEINVATQNNVSRWRDVFEERTVLSA